MIQMDLFGGPDEVVVVPPLPAAPAAPIPREEPAEVPVGKGQLGLFGLVAAARTRVEDLIGVARFAEALREAREIERVHGTFFAVPDAACLEPLARVDLDAADHAAVRRAWREARDLARHAWRRDDLASGLARRLRVPPLELAGSDGVLVEDVIRLSARANAPSLTRTLVRDALLAGMPVGPDDVTEGPVRELLRDDLSPERLACLGGILRLWVVEPRPVPESDPEERRTALRFWNALATALRPEAHVPDEILQARTRMKEADPELHARFMGRG